MSSSGKHSSGSTALSLILILAVVGAVAAAFLYTGGWLAPPRTTPDKIVAALAPPGGPALGRRRNHVKGVCFTGVFAANGAGASLSTAAMLASGEYPVIGRFNLASADISAPDGGVRVRGLSLAITAPDGEEWRTAMIDAPFFPVATPAAFYDLLVASKSKDPGAMGAFVAAHPELPVFGAWAKSAPWTASYAEERYNSLNSFVFTNGGGAQAVVRWSFVPSVAPTPVAADALKQLGPDFLEQEIAERVGHGPLRWEMLVTIADPGDPTANPSKPWPATRRVVDVGTLIVKAVEAEPEGPCRDINYDPTVLPAGITVSDDPFPAARSSAYRRSYDLRAAEARFYPGNAAGAAP